MNTIDAAGVRGSRVDEARRRLREASRPARHSEPVDLSDHAVRIARLDAPVLGSSIALHPGLAVIGDLDDQARHALSATIASLHDGDRRGVLDGELIVDDERLPLRLDLTESVLQNAGATRIFRTIPELAPIATTETHALHSVLHHLDSAIALTEAELRGADEFARSTRARDASDEPIEEIADRVELEESLEALDALEPDPSVVEAIAEHLELLGDKRRELALESAVAQYAAAVAAVQPSDSAAVRDGVSEALDGARREH
ncbi:MAG: hypothetical protein ACR2P0_16420, partial [Acidimicrobiales bacterium]